MQKPPPNGRGFCLQRLKELKSGYDYQMCSAPMQLVTPRVVMMAVRMLMMSWMMNFHVSLFQFIIHTIFHFTLSILHSPLSPQRGARGRVFLASSSSSSEGWNRLSIHDIALMSLRRSAQNKTGKSGSSPARWQALRT